MCVGVCVCVCVCVSAVGAAWHVWHVRSCTCCTPQPSTSALDSAVTNLALSHQHTPKLASRGVKLGVELGVAADSGSQMNLDFAIRTVHVLLERLEMVRCVERGIADVELGRQECFTMCCTRHSAQANKRIEELSAVPPAMRRMGLPSDVAYAKTSAVPDGVGCAWPHSLTHSLTHSQFHGGVLSNMQTCTAPTVLVLHSLRSWRASLFCCSTGSCACHPLH